MELTLHLFATKFIFAICCLVCAQNILDVLVSGFANFQIHIQYTLSSVLSKIFCLLKSSDCIYDIVCTKTDLWESFSLTGIKDRGGLVHPSKHISKCMRVAKTTVRHFIDHEGMLPNLFQKILTSSHIHL